MEWNGMEWNGMEWNAEWNTECGIFRKTRAFFREKNLKIFSLYTMRRRETTCLASRISSFCVINQISFVASFMTVIEVNVYIYVTVRQVTIIIS